MFRLDPHRLPISLTAADPVADGGNRVIEISRDGVEFSRAIRGVPMRVRLPFSAFDGVAVRVLAPGGMDPVIFLSLEHEDDDLSVLLQASEDSDECATAARQWSRVTGRPILVAGPDGRLQNPASIRKAAATHGRRKRHGALRNRRCMVRSRQQRAAHGIADRLHEGEREIIARD